MTTTTDRLFIDENIFFIFFSRTSILWLISTFCCQHKNVLVSVCLEMFLSFFSHSSVRIRLSHVCLFLGGIPRSKLSKVFNYTYSTAPEPQSKNGFNGVNGTAIAGLGYGLPIARLYARYFQGNLSLASIEDLGTSAYVTLKVKIPVFLRSPLSFSFFFVSRPRLKMLGKQTIDRSFVRMFVVVVFSREFLPVFSTSRYTYTTDKGSDWTVQLKN